MLRAVVLLFAALEVTAPDRIVAWGERLAFETPGASPLRPWTLPMARLEGVAFAWLVLGGRARSATLGRFVGLLGVPALLFPERFLATALALAYEEPDALEVKPWVVPLTRLVGVAYVLVGLRSLARGSR